MAPINIFNNPWKKYRPLKTVALYCSFLALGLAASILGPTLVSMEILLDTNTKAIAAAFSGGSVGYLSGSFLCGFIYAPLNKELLFSMAVFGVALTTALEGFSQNLYMFIAVCAVQGFGMAMIDTAGQSYVLKLWEGHKYKESIMQGAHGIWSVGSTTGPFLIRPFLSDILEANQCNSTTESVADVTATVAYEVLGTVDFLEANFSAFGDEESTVLSGGSSGNCSAASEEEIKESVGFVRLAYILIASLVLVCSIMFITAFILMKPSCRDRTREKKSDKEKTTYTRSYRSFRVSLLVIMFCFYFVYLWVEGTPGAFLAAFVVKGLGWPNKHGALITSVYWGAHGMGRLLGVPVAMWLTPRSMLIIDMVMTMFGFSLLLFVGYVEWLIWVGVSVAGLGMGTIFASGILWMESYMEVTGAASSVLLIAASLGGVVSPILTGYLFQEFSHMCFVYVIVTASVLELVIFIGAHCYAQKNGASSRSRKTELPSLSVNGVEMSRLNQHGKNEKRMSTLSNGDDSDHGEMA